MIAGAWLLSVALATRGGRRGLLTPGWWDERNSQFGLLKEWRVTEAGTWVDGVRVSDVRLDDLAIVGRRTIDVRIGVEEGVTHVGGVNLFGRRSGNYPEDLTLSVAYRPP